MEEGDAVKRALVRGPLLSESGYGNHARQVFRWLVKKHPELDIRVQVLPWGTTSWHVNPDSEQGLIGEIMGRTGNIDQKFDLSFQIQLPNEWDPKLANFNVGITAVVESDLCNPAWIQACNSMSMVVVPSQFCKKTLESTGKINVPVHVIPESFIPEILDENKKFDIDFDTNFNFLLLGTLTGNNPQNDRKNIFYALKWICEEFANDPDVGIILKTNAGRGTRTDWPHLESMIRNVIAEVRKGPYPKVHLIHGIVPNSNIAGLYVHPKVKMLIAPTRGEGFGLPILEAAASGLPVAATEFSGHMDFMKMGKFTKFEYDLKPIHESRVDNVIWMKDTKWAEVRESDFKKKLRKFRSSHEVPRQWAKELAVKLRETHSPDRIDEEYEKVIGHITK
jgi:glycosyltransferase involved in cell wall biosynthesis